MMLRGTRAHHAGDLRDALGAHLRLIVEYPPEVIAVGEDLALVRQVGAARIDQVDARQAVGLGNLLRAEMLLDRHRVIGAALHSGIVGDDHAHPPRNPPDRGDDPGTRNLAVVEVAGGELAELEQRRAGIEQALDALAGEQLAARCVALARGFATAQRGCGDPGVQFIGQRPVVRGAGLCFGGVKGE
jgi:hypothetical protein